jgi:hypothetical protein
MSSPPAIFCSGLNLDDLLQIMGNPPVDSNGIIFNAHPRRLNATTISVNPVSDKMRDFWGYEMLARCLIHSDSDYGFSWDLGFFMKRSESILCVDPSQFIHATPPGFHVVTEIGEVVGIEELTSVHSGRCMPGEESFILCLDGPVTLELLGDEVGYFEDGLEWFGPVKLQHLVRAGKLIVNGVKFQYASILVATIPQGWGRFACGYLADLTYRLSFQAELCLPRHGDSRWQVQSVCVGFDGKVIFFTNINDVHYNLIASEIWSPSQIFAKYKLIQTSATEIMNAIYEKWPSLY